MAQYFYDFANDTVDQFPSGWTKEWLTTGSTVEVKADGSAIGGKVLEHTNDTSTIRVESIDEIDSDANRDHIEVVIKVKISSLSSEQATIIVRGSGGSSSKNGYSLAIAPSFSGYDLARWNNNNWNYLTTHVMTFETDTWYWLRFQVSDEGSDVRIRTRIWEDGDSEPGTWDINGLDSGGNIITGVGFVAIGKEHNTGTTTFDAIGVGTNGDEAPTSGQQEITQTVTSSAKASIKRQVSQSVDVKARIEVSSESTIDAKARIEKSREETISVTARIEKEFTQSVNALARIEIQTSQTISAIGRVQKQSSQSVNAKARIINTYSSTVDAKADIKTEQEKTISAIGRIEIARWYNASWLYRIKLTIQASKVDADLTDYPVYVDLSDLPSDFHSNVKSDGGDIRVTKADGVTELPREVVVYDADNDTGELHIKYTGTLSGTVDTEIYIYYGNAGAEDYARDHAYGLENVWGSDYQLVAHLQESADGTADEYKDSSPNENHGRGGDGQSGKIPAQAVGQIEKGQDLDGSNDFIDFGVVPAMVGIGSMTVSLWFEWQGSVNNMGDSVWIFGIGHPGEANTEAFAAGGGWDGSHNKGRFYFKSASSSWITSGDTSSIIADGNKHKLDYVYDGSNLKVYVDGQLEADANVGSHVNASGTGHLIAGGHVDPTPPDYEEVERVNGLLDEIRAIAGTYRDANWLSTEYNNQYDPSSFYNVGVQEEQDIQVTVSRTVSALARLELVGGKSISAKGNIRSEITQSISAKASVQKEFTQTISAVGRITLSRTKTIDVKGNILATQSKTIDSKARIEKEFSKTISTKARIEIQSIQSINALGRIEISSTQTISGKANIVATQTQSIEAKGRIGLPGAKEIDAKASIKKQATTIISAKGAIQKTFIQSVNAKGRISIASQQSVSAKGAIKETFMQSVNAIARIQILGKQTISSKANIQTSREQTIEAKARIGGGGYETIETKANIVSTSQQSISAIGRIQIQSTQDINAKASILITNDANISAKARIEIAEGETIWAKASILKTQTKTISAIGRIAIIGTSEISAKARIEAGAVVQSINAKANIVSTQTQTVSAKASIGGASYRNIQAKARISIPREQTIEAKGLIASKSVQTINAKGNIFGATEKSISAKASIKYAFEQSVNAKARIVITNSATISAKGYIARIDVIEIIDRVRTQSIVKEVVYPKVKVREVLYTSDTGRVIVAEVNVPRVKKTKWFTARARIVL